MCACVCMYIGNLCHYCVCTQHVCLTHAECIATKSSTCMYVSLCICLLIQERMCESVCVRACLHASIHSYVCACVLCVCVCVCVCVRACVHTCMCGLPLTPIFHHNCIIYHKVPERVLFRKLSEKGQIQMYWF